MLQPLSPTPDLRTERKAYTLTLQHNDEFPDKPSELAVKDVEMRIKNQEILRLVADLFEQRPMWNRIAITNKTGMDDGLLK